jgi:NTP pyrophosphatase (non-canonical NTP hydrolase)
MDLDRYQELSAQTDQFGAGKKKDDELMIPLLGLAGETGTLLAEFKKKIRDRESYDGFRERAEEEIGDVLWYLANIATRLNLSLSAIASKNLTKTQERWPIGGRLGPLRYLDQQFPASEQLPRRMRIHVKGDAENKRSVMIRLPQQILLGDPLTDNSYIDDGYRFHDVIHLAFAAVLGWSPAMRRLLGCKRKSDAKVDEVEDGARAAVLEELIVAFVYSNARERRYYEGIQHLDTEMLLTIKRIVSHVEVARRPMQLWERAILQGYSAFRHLLENQQAVLRLDMKARQLVIEK